MTFATAGFIFCVIVVAGVVCVISRLQEDKHLDTIESLVKKNAELRATLSCRNKEIENLSSISTQRYEQIEALETDISSLKDSVIDNDVFLMDSDKLIEHIKFCGDLFSDKLLKEKMDGCLSDSADEKYELCNEVESDEQE